MIKKIEKNYAMIILSLTFLLPFFDMYRTVVGNKFEIFGISFVELFNFIFTTIIAILLLIKSKNNKKKILSKKNILLLATYFIYLFLHISYITTLSKVSYINSSISILTELYFIIRSYILPLIILFVYMKSDLNIKNVVKVLSIVSFIFSIVIVLSNLFGISYIAYSSVYEGTVKIKGNIFTWFNNLDTNSIDLYTSKGLFYSTNQLSAILGALSFISVFYATYKDKIVYYISFFIKIIALLMISTKTAFFAIIFSILSLFIYAIIDSSINKKNILTKKSTLLLIYAILILIIFNYSPIKYKMDGYITNLSNNNTISYSEDVGSKCKSEKTILIEETNNFDLNEVMSDDNITSNEKEYLTSYINDCPSSFGIPKEYIQFYDVKNNFNFWMKIVHKPISELTNYRKFKNSIYNNFLHKHNIFIDELLGIGYTSNFPYLELDFAGQKVWFGYIGILLLIMPYVIVLLCLSMYLFINIKKKLNIFTISSLLAAFYMLFASVLAGHVFGNFITSTILALILSGLYSYFRHTEIKNNKISFLLLHLGYGGIESSTINTANALCDKFDIELVSFYNLENNQENKIKKEVKVIHLYNGSPNRDEFLSALKKHKYLKVIIEGIKSISILIKKKIYVINYILNCDSRYLISTRWDFSLLLNKFGREETIKIAQEHHYHNNNKKYINKLKKYKRIDYLFALTDRLEHDYKNILKNNNHTKIVKVPNMLESIPSKKSLLEDNNIITVSRLDEGKRNDEIIKIFSKLNNKKWKLYIIGDGKEIDNLSKLVKKLNLEKQVILTGYKNKKEIEKYMLESSIFLMASVSEGLPMVLLEAMSYGLPCIAYETASGTNDIIKNNINGYIINNRDEDEYIEKLKELMNNNNLRKKMGESAKNTSIEFSKEKIVEIWLNILKQK